ncbi:hypothetical protein IAR50_007060 [Cryptococcus sp. DSM 104548]
MLTVANDQQLPSATASLGDLCSSMTSVTTRDTLKVLWPTSGLTRQQGVLVGWRIEGAVCVVAIVEDCVLQEPNKDGQSSNRLQDLEPLGTARAGSKEVLDSPEGLILYLDDDRRPISSSQPVSLILYDPPTTSSLRYFNLGSEGEPSYGYSVPPEGGSIFQELDWQQVVTKLNASYGAHQHLIRHLGTSKGSAAAEKTQTDTDSLDAQTTLLSSRFLGLPPLRDLSASVDQLCIRLNQLVRVPDRYLRARQVGDVKQRAEMYTLFWNTVYLVLNDLILGYLAHDTILHYGLTVFAPLQSTFQRHLVDTPIQALQWLNSWPVGLKLNTPLSQFFCVFFQGVIRHWSEIVTPHLFALTPHLPKILALASLTGLSTSLALITDLFSLLTLHLAVSWKAMQWVCGWQASSLYGLWNLFRGKRWNVLRLRTDSYEYDLDQLFLGTLLFTVSAFLFPTVLSYSALFFLMRIACLAVDGVLRGGRKVLQKLPLFELMLRLKDPARLPGGINLEAKTLKGGAGAGDREGAEIGIEQVLVLTSTPKSFWDIIGQAFGR